MKKCLLIAGLAVLSTSAYATTTRLQALGQDTTRGSFFIDDNYNVFRNAAYVNQYKNYMVTEWGQENGNQAAAEEQLEGGFFREMGSFTYGVYFNNESDTAEGLSQGGSSFIDAGERFKQSTNGIDLFFGGDMGVQWGARIHYASSTDKIAANDVDNDVTGAYDLEHSAMNLSLGMMMGDLGAYANVGIKNEYTGAYAVDIAGGTADDTTDAGEGDADMKTDKLEGSGSLNLGVNYKMGNMKVYVDYSSGGMEYTDASSPDFKKEFTRTTINVGVGHTHEVSSTARVFSSIGYVTQTDETKATATITVEDKETYIPILIGFEADANSWLTLRGSISQNLPFLNKSEYTNSGDADDNEEDKGEASTAFNAGATLNFGKLQVDGIIGNGTSSDELQLDNLFSKVAVIYNF